MKLKDYNDIIFKNDIVFQSVKLKNLYSKNWHSSEQCYEKPAPPSLFRPNRGPSLESKEYKPLKKRIIKL